MNRFDRAYRSVRFAAATLLAAVLLSACASSAPPPAASQGPASAPAAAPGVPVAAPVIPQTGSVENFYRLGAKDRIRVIVFGEEDLSGEFEVDGSGVIAMPLVGQVQAAGKTLREVEEAIAVKLREGYLNDPRVSAEVLNYRPFYIFGEVVNGGEYSFTDGMTILNAVAVAGGYTYRADQRRVYITREGVGERQYDIEMGIQVLPGDVIKVPERYF